jgi:xylulokinase
MHVLALDVGTSSVKAAVLDVSTARPVGPIAKADYDLDRPTPDAAELPPERLWNAVVEAGRAAAAGVGGITRIGLAVMTPVLVLLDRADQPLGPIWTHLDRRARPAAREVWHEVGQEFLATTGNRPLPGGMTAVCYRQRLADEPGLRDRVGSYLHGNGWLALHLTGERAFDRANACFTGLYGTMTGQAWSSRWCDYFQVDERWLPSVMCGSTTIGALRSSAAAELGVPAGLPVKLGTADTSSAMLAAGMGSGDLLHVVGTTQVVAALTNQPQPDPKRLTRQLGVGEAFIHVAHNPVGGKETFYRNTIPQALDRATTVSLDPPFLGGDRLEIEVARAGLRDMTLATDRLDVLASVLRAMREQHYKALAALGAGQSFRRIFLTGGGSEVVRRLIPEYAGADIKMLEEGSLRGVARLFGTQAQGAGSSA